MLTKLIELGRKMKEEMEAPQSEIKQNIQGTNSEGKEIGTQSTVWNKRKKETSNWNKMKKQEFRKMRRGLGISGTTLSTSTTES